jgi:hypothetical protein
MTLHAARAEATAWPHDGQQTQRALGGWLLGAVQLRAGPEAGGVAGAVDGGGRPLYVYPEITGYYLQWLSWKAARQTATPALAQRAVAAQRWLASWILRPEPLQTRVYVRAHEADWRNSALFCFDLAMVLRGVASASAIGIIEPEPVLLERLFAQLSRLVAADGRFMACVAQPGVTLPDRWSTRPGSFLAKAAAAVLVAARVLPEVPATLQAAAEATLAASIRAAIKNPHEEAHPQLYAIEGALMLASHPAVALVLPQFTRQIDELLSSATVRGAFVESTVIRGTERLDVIAQVLRAAYLLRAFVPEWSPDSRGLAVVQQFLVRQATFQGGAPFNAAPAASPYCVWAATFAEQALELARTASRGMAGREMAHYIV